MTINISNSIKCGIGQDLLWILGPCVIEPGDITFAIAGDLAEISYKYDIPLVFKASFDKANRSSPKSYRGVGLNAGLDMLARIKDKHKLLITTDVHELWQVSRVAEVCDIIQIPAFLARQTDLVQAAGRTKLVVNVKKAQFMAPWHMINVIDKLEETGNRRILLTERGSSFGYDNVVCDMRSLPIMRGSGYPVVFDATHGSKGINDGVESHNKFVPHLARAAVAVGCDALFLEVHRDPQQSLSDGQSMLRIGDLPKLIKRCLGIRGAVENCLVGAG